MMKKVDLLFGLLQVSLESRFFLFKRLCQLRYVQKEILYSVGRSVVRAWSSNNAGSGNKIVH